MLLQVGDYTYCCAIFCGHLGLNNIYAWHFVRAEFVCLSPFLASQREPEGMKRP